MVTAIFVCLKQEVTKSGKRLSNNPRRVQGKQRTAEHADEPGERRQLSCVELKLGVHGHAVDGGAGQNNEYDKWLDLVGEGNNLIHWPNMYSWMQDTYTGNSAYRVIRGYSSARYFNYSSASTSNANVGFRPVLIPLNSAPLISDSDRDLGSKSAAFTVPYSVSEAAGENFSILKVVDTTTIRSLSNQSSGDFTLDTSGVWSSLALGAHTLKITATDPNDASAVRTFTFTRVNSAPVISGSDVSLGTFSATAPAPTYTVNDADGDSVSVTERLDGATLRTYSATLGATNTLALNADAWQKVLNGSHTATVTASDGKDSVTRTYMFTKSVTAVEFTLTTARPASTMPVRASFLLDGAFPSGSILSAQACNNANDAVPTWEDVTAKLRLNGVGGAMHRFANKTKTAANWGVNLHVTLQRGTAVGSCYVSGGEIGFDYGNS